jgi:hypothetical protein
MKDQFIGTCYGLKEASGRSCTVTPRGTALEISAGGVFLANLDYHKLTISLTGMDDRYLCFQAPFEGADVRVLVADREIISRIEALGAPRTVMDKLRSAVHSRKRRQLGRWGVLGILLGIDRKSVV